MDNKTPDDNSVMRALAAFTHLGLIVVVYIASGVLIGRWLDSLLGTGNILMFVMLGAGVVGAFWSAYNFIMKLMK